MEFKSVFCEGLDLHQHLCIETIIVPEMAPEFEYDHSYSISIYFVDTYKGTMKNLSYVEAKKFYGRITGRDDRIGYWHALQHLRQFDIDPLPDGSCVEAHI